MAAHTVMALSIDFGPTPKPGPALAARIAAGDCEVYGIVHWGLNTYTDREWGYGDEDPALLNPAKFDADQIVGACKAGGLGGLIVVAKHHDGFCLWPTKTTEHNIRRSPFWTSGREEGTGDREEGLIYGRTIGIKRIRTLKSPCRAENMRLEVYGDNAAALPLKFYYVEPEFLKAVLSATTESGETDTAKWMTAGKQGIPILLLYGGQDATVPPAKNCELFVKKFKAAGGKIDIRHRALYGHHPHGEDPDKTSSIVSFFEAKK